MKQLTLYTGGGVSLSPLDGEGRRVSAYVRLIADEGKGITNGAVVTECADVLATDVPKWSDCEAPADEDEIPAEEALAELVEVLQ